MLGDYLLIYVYFGVSSVPTRGSHLCVLRISEILICLRDYESTLYTYKPIVRGNQKFWAPKSENLFIIITRILRCLNITNFVTES